MSEKNHIEISKSALISLKAELLRKQEEVSKAKQNAKNQIENFKPSSKFSEDVQEDKLSKNEDSNINRNTAEECEALRKSKEALEKKSIIYEHLSQTCSAGDKDQYLVQFDKKEKEQIAEDVIHKSPNYSSNDSDEEWTDYLDCFGRTRCCHKSDLEHMKKRDEELKKSVRKNVPDVVNKAWIKEGEVQDLVSPDAYKEQLRSQWEQKEQELLTKDNIHYEDVRFNEARGHGVGYYALSSDADERAKQQAELASIRAQTEKAQVDVSEARRKREEAIQSRVKAARARQRIRAGLPPDEEEPKKSVTSGLLDFIEEQKNISAKQAAEKARREREEKEEIAKKEREKIVREWDLDKEELQSKMPFSQMTQEEWVSKKRLERIEEFAPPESLDSKRKNKETREFDHCGFFIDSKVDESHNSSKSWKNKQKLYYDPSVNMSTSSFEPVPISNECEGESSTKEDFRSMGAEIAPPATYDYYGPSEKKQKTIDGHKTNVSEAFEYGLRYLEEKKYKG